MGRNRFSPSSIRIGMVATIVLSITTSSVLVAQSEPVKKYKPAVVEKADAILSEMGLRRSGKSIQAITGAEISRAISGLTRKKRELRLIHNEWKAIADRIALLRQELQRLNQQYGQLNLQLAQVAGRDVSANNRIVGLINATNVQRKTIIDQREQARVELAERRAVLNQAEADYAETVLAIRRDFDAMHEKLLVALNHPQAATAFEVLYANFATPEQPTITTILGSLDKRIERLEQEVFSEAIKLDVVRNSLYVNVVIGKKTSRMAVDSGASVISLPRHTATELGLQVPADAPQMRLVLADGRTIPARGIVIPTVRVGEFEASNVEAAVLDAAATEAEPLLGMSFLGNFKFEIDSADKTLKLLRVTSD